MGGWGKASFMVSDFGTVYAVYVVRIVCSRLRSLRRGVTYVLDIRMVDALPVLGLVPGGPGADPPAGTRRRSGAAGWGPRGL